MLQYLWDETSQQCFETFVIESTYLPEFSEKDVSTRSILWHLRQFSHLAGYPIIPKGHPAIMKVIKPLFCGIYPSKSYSPFPVGHLLISDAPYWVIQRFNLIIQPFHKVISYYKGHTGYPQGHPILCSIEHNRMPAIPEFYKIKQ